MDRAEKELIIFESVLLLANKLQSLGDKFLEPFTMKQWFLLTMMSRMEQKTPTVKEIADYTGTSRQNVKQMLELLEKNGYVEINKSVKDGRALCVSMTRKCMQYFSEGGQKGDLLIANLFGSVPEPELDACLNMLHSLFVNAYALMDSVRE